MTVTGDGLRRRVVCGMTKHLPSDLQPALRKKQCVALSSVCGRFHVIGQRRIRDRRTYGSSIPASWVALWLIVVRIAGRGG